MSVLSAIVSLTEPFRAGWARLRFSAPPAHQHPEYSSCLGPWELLPLCRGHREQKAERSGGKAKVGCEQACGDGDLMT